MKDKVSCFFKSQKSNILKSIAFLLYLLVLLSIFVIVVNVNVVQNFKDKIYGIDDIESIFQNYECILILGAGVRDDGSPSPMLFDRLQTGKSAFLACEADFVFLSGDSESENYTETVTMRNELIKMGIEEDDIISDGYGLSTYESIWRIKYVYGFDKILIISQKYHLYRALYIANELGIDAIGIDAALRKYGKQPIYSLREYLARFKDVFFTELRLNPTYIQRWEDFIIE